MPLFLRRFRLADMEELLAIERACLGRDAYDRNLFAEYLRVCGALFLVVEDGTPAARGTAEKPDPSGVFYRVHLPCSGPVWPIWSPLRSLPKRAAAARLPYSYRAPFAA